MAKHVEIFGKKSQIREISIRKKQLREKAIKSFGDIKLKNLTYTKSPKKVTSDQSILLHNKQKEFLIENKSEILNLLEFIEKVNEGVLNKDEVEKHMFDMTNVNTKFENMWFNTTKFIKKSAMPIGVISTLPGFFVLYGLGSYFFRPNEFWIDLSVYVGAFGGFAVGGISAEILHDTSKIAKRADKIKLLNHAFEKAYIYHDDWYIKDFE